MKKIILLIVPLLYLSVTFAPMLVVHAQSTPNYITVEETGIQYGERIGLGNKDIRTTVADIIRVAMGLLGIVAVVIVLIGGFIWMTAGGNDEKIGEAKKWIFAGVIGLAIILMAYSISAFVVNQLVTATTQ